MKKLLSLLVCFCLLFTIGCQNGNNITSPDSKFDRIEHVTNVIMVTIDELRIIRNAVNTMPEDEFKSFMFWNHGSGFNNIINNLKNAKTLMEELEATTIPVLDGDINNISKLSIDCDDNYIYQFIAYDSEMIQRIGARIYTANYTGPKEKKLTKDIKLFSIKNIKNDKYTVKLYETRNSDDKFIAEISIDGSYIVLRSAGIETMDQFEECFSRLEFRKIGDLMDEMPEKSPDEDSLENEQISVTENVLFEETILSEQPQNDEIESRSTENVYVSEETTLFKQDEITTE